MAHTISSQDYRQNALAYYHSGRVAPYEESFQLGDSKDVRFASISLWRSKDPTVCLITKRYSSKADKQSDDIVSSARIYLKRQPVHPEAHSKYAVTNLVA